MEEALSEGGNNTPESFKPIVQMHGSLTSRGELDTSNMKKINGAMICHNSH